MAITALSNEQIQTLVNAAYAQMTGSTDVSTMMDLTKFTDNGEADVKAYREKFTKALLAVSVKTWYLDGTYRSSFKDVFYEDASRFGAIVQMISIKAPEVKENSAWKNFVSGTTTVGQYTVFIPMVDSKYYGKSESWSLPVTITGEQWDTAFRSMEDLNSFVGYVFMVIDNAIVQHMEDLNAANRNNFIAEKIAAQTADTDGRVHVLDLVAAYVADRGITTSLTVEDFLSSKECLNFAIEQIKLYMGYMQKQSVLFNTGKWSDNSLMAKFVPKDRLVVQLLDYFVARLETVARSETFHNDLVALPYYEAVPAWQSMADLSFDGLSSINVNTASGTLEKAGIVGFIADKWAIIHTIKSERVASQHFDIEDLTHYEYQFRDQYMNNLTLPALVVVLNDHTVII